jgi:transposase
LIIVNSLFENIPAKVIKPKEKDIPEGKMIQKERKQSSLFDDNWIYKIVLEKFPDHPLVKLKPLVNKIIGSIERNLEVKYAKDFGRPSYPPSVILKMLLLEYLYNLSDVAVSQAVFCNILFRWFCDLDIFEPVPDDTTLVKFRKRLGEEGFKDVFSSFIEAARELGYGKGRLRILDATHVFSFSRGLSVGGLLKEGIKRVIKMVKEKALTLSKKVETEARKVIGARHKLEIRELRKVVKEVAGN